MPSAGPKTKTKPKASEVATDIKRHFLPFVRKHYGHCYRMYSLLHPQPLYHLQFPPSREWGRVPRFCDPVTIGISWAKLTAGDNGTDSTTAFICPANDKRPGGDWETGVVGYEERLCRRSNLSATLASPHKSRGIATNFPIPIEGGVMSEDVVIFCGPHERPSKDTPIWDAIPVCSVPPVRWPKLTQMGSKYSFAEERDMVKRKLRAALYICASHGYPDLVIGDFGLGNSYRNPPQEMAEMWREILLWDQTLRSRIRSVAFVFEDPTQNTTRLILDDLHKRSRHTTSRGGKGTCYSASSSSSSIDADYNGMVHALAGSAYVASAALAGNPAAAARALRDVFPLEATGDITAAPPAPFPCDGALPSDYAIFRSAFSPDEVARALTQPDPRYELGMLMSPM